MAVAAMTVNGISSDRNSLYLPEAGDAADFGTSSFLGEKPLGKFSEALFDSAHSFDALSYRIFLVFPMTSDFYLGNVLIRFQVAEDTLSFIRLHMAGLIADSVFAGALRTNFIRDDTSIAINLGAMHYYPETLQVRIFYHDTADGRGYYHYGRNSYTMAEPQDARWWFPCYDEPWDKATMEIYTTVPEQYQVGSNGYLADVNHDQISHLKTYHWVSNFPIATYLINLIMGEYATWTDYYIEDNGDSIPIFNMVWREDSAAAAYDFATVPDMMRLYSDLFYPYPFEKYGQGTVSPFLAGGMEHQTMTTLNRSWITGDRRVELGYAHELSHMWWGDMVTMADWRHIWLNEGFATYASALYNEAAYGREAFALHMLDYQNIYFAYEQSAGRHPIFDPPDLFGVNVYVKGAWVLHMLRGIVGDADFFSGLHAYAGAYAYGNASTDEFRDSMEGACECELNPFFDQWVYGQGFPVYNYSWRWWAEGDSFRILIDIAQVQTASPVFMLPIPIRIIAGDTMNFSLDNYLPVQRFELSLPAAPTALLFDPDNWIMDSSRVVLNIDDPEGTLLPSELLIENVYPNPFNGSAKIEFAIGRGPQEISLDIYDIEGRLVRNILNGQFNQARFAVSWNGSGRDGYGVASGIYFVRLAGEKTSAVSKIIYLR
jgi:aminopeptidase N